METLHRHLMPQCQTKDEKVVRINEPYLNTAQSSSFMLFGETSTFPHVMMACTNIFPNYWIFGSIHFFELCTNIAFCNHFPLQYFRSFQIKYVQKGNTTHESINADRKYTQFTIHQFLVTKCHNVSLSLSFFSHCIDRP